MEIPKTDIQDFDCLIEWHKRFTPRAEIHVSGGECLLRPDIEDQIEKLASAGIPTTIFTNGLLVGRRRRLLDMPLKWHITHHGQNDFVAWRQNADLLRNKPHIATRVMYGIKNEREAAALAPQYAGLNFHWQRLNGLKIGDSRPIVDDLPRVASGVVHLIRPDGRVYACNSVKRPPIGDTIRGQYDPRLAKKHDRTAKACVMGQGCAAYQTAVWLSRL